MNVTEVHDIKDGYYLLLSIAILMLFLLVYFPPRNEFLSEIEKNEFELRDKIERAYRFRNVQDLYAEQYSALINQNTKYSSLLQDEIDNQQKQQQWTQELEKYHLEVNSIDWGKIKASEFYNAHPFTLKLSGNYENIYNFLYDTFYLPNKAILIDGINIARLNNDISLTARIDGIIYSYNGENWQQ